jgi:hypothetical protein
MPHFLFKNHKRHSFGQLIARFSEASVPDEDYELNTWQASFMKMLKNS